MATSDSSPTNWHPRWSLLLLGLVFGALALAQNIVMTGAAIVTEVNGSVQVRIGNNPPVALRPGNQLAAGAIVSTGNDANSVLTFADGQVIVLGERTQFRIVNFDYDPKEMSRSGVFLNLIEGSARLVMGTIGQFDPTLIRIQVGTGTLFGAPNPDGGRIDASVVVQGAATIVTVEQGRVTLTLPTGQGIVLAAGQGAFVQANGAVQQGNLDQITTQVGQSPDGKQVLEQLDLMQAYVFPQSNQQTIITLATPATPSLPDDPTSAITPSLPNEPTAAIGEEPRLASSTITTASTGAGGGGTPCAASCN